MHILYLHICVQGYTCDYWISRQNHLTLLELQAESLQSQTVFKFSQEALPLLLQSQKLLANTRWSEIYALYMLMVETVNPWGGLYPNGVLKRDDRLAEHWGQMNSSNPKLVHMCMCMTVFDVCERERTLGACASVGWPWAFLFPATCWRSWLDLRGWSVKYADKHAHIHTHTHTHAHTHTHTHTHTMLFRDQIWFIMI